MGYTPGATGPQGRKCRNRGRGGMSPSSHRESRCWPCCCPLWLMKSNEEYQHHHQQTWHRTSFLDPVKPSDSMEKHQKGTGKMRDRLGKRETRFQRSQVKAAAGCDNMLCSRVATAHWCGWRRGKGRSRRSLRVTTRTRAHSTIC